MTSKYGKHGLRLKNVGSLLAKLHECFKNAKKTFSALFVYMGKLKYIR